MYTKIQLKPFSFPELFIIVKNWTQSKCPKGEEIMKPWLIPALKSLAATENDFIKKYFVSQKTHHAIVQSSF